MDAKQVDVMVADASHEVYVDKILDTIIVSCNRLQYNYNNL